MGNTFAEFLQILFFYVIQNLYIIIPGLIVSIIPAMALINNRVAITSRQSVIVYFIAAISIISYGASLALKYANYYGVTNIPHAVLYAIDIISTGLITAITLNGAIYSAGSKNLVLAIPQFIFTVVYFVCFVSSIFIATLH